MTATATAFAAITRVHQARLEIAVAATMRGVDVIFAAEHENEAHQMAWYEGGVRNVILRAETQATFARMFELARIEFVRLLAVALRYPGVEQ